MKMISSLTIIATYGIVLGQGYTNVPLKEDFDRFNRYETSFGMYSYDPNELDGNGLDKDGGNFGDGICKILESYIKMYEVTKDKAYLYKFVHESLLILRNRHDIHPNADFFVNDQPRWSRGDQMYQDGYIVASFSRFVYLIKIQEPDLFLEPIYPFEELDPNLYTDLSKFTNFSGINFSTFGEYANWLQDRVGETLYWFIDNGYWDNGYAIRQNTTHDYSANLNQSVGFARAFLFNGLTAGNQDFLDKAQLMEDLLLGNIYIIDQCDDLYYNHNLLRVNNDNSTWMYQAGWRVQEHCFPKTQWYDKYVENMEDIGHAVVDTWMLRDFFLYNPNTNINEAQLIQFRNMFTKNIYNDLDETFKIAVNGASNPQGIVNQEIIAKLSGNNGHTGYCESMSYMWFYRFDDADNTAGAPYTYNICFDYYNDYVGNNVASPPFYGGQAQKGHSEMVEAQWDKECPDLTLDNRKLVYNQDFYSKRNLIIDPINVFSSNTYAFPLLQGFIEFLVESGVESEMKASESISIKPGVHIKAGSDYHAFIDPLLCGGGNGNGGGNGTAGNGGGNNKMQEPTTGDIDSELAPVFGEESDLLADENFFNELEMIVHPVPFDDEIVLNYFIPQNGRITIKIYDLLGKEVQTLLNRSFQEKGQYTANFDVSLIENGIYNIVLIHNDNSIVKKVVKNK